MNAIAIKPKTIELVPARTAPITSITWRTSDDAFQRKLQVVVNNATAFQVADADYDALGQWTDDTIKGLILARFGLELA
ncbi:MAG: hypothetical protein WCS42_25010 [Verrucomicrobiota bacterium]